jgi:hypothetical protein
MRSPSNADAHLEEVLAALGTFSYEEKAQLAGHLQQLRVGEGKSVKAMSRGEKAEAKEPLRDDWLLKGIAWEAHRRGKLAHPDAGAFLGTDGYKAYKKKAADAKALLLSGFKAPPSGRDLETLGCIAARCLFEHLRYIQGLPVGTVLANVDKIGVAVDAAFPGYVQMGIMSVLLSSAGASVFLGK